MSEKQNMLESRPYNAADPELVQERNRARELLKQLNFISPQDGELRARLQKELLPNAAEDLHIEYPFFCDYGAQIYTGKNVFINFNCTILDCAPVEIGDNTLIGPSVQIYTATHPLMPQKRLEGLESAQKVRIGKNVWLGGGCIILPGVWVGDNAVVAAGAVVTRDVAPGTVVAGSPAKVIRRFLV